MNRSYSKIRNINSVNYLLEQKYLEDKRNTDRGVLVEQQPEEDNWFNNMNSSYFDRSANKDYSKFPCVSSLKIAKGNRLRFDANYYYFPNGNYATIADVNKYSQDYANNPNTTLNYAGTYSCKETINDITNQKTSSIQRSENPKKELASSTETMAAAAERQRKELGYGEGKGDEGNWKNTRCALTMGTTSKTPTTSPNYPGKEHIYYDVKDADLSIFNGYLEDDDVHEVYLFNTGVFYVGSTPYPKYQRGPSDENKFYKYTCVGGKVKPTKEIIGIEGSQDRNSTQSTTSGGGFGTVYPNVFTPNVVSTIRTKIGSGETSPTLTQTDINLLYTAIEKA
jgi:hypothetical protein